MAYGNIRRAGRAQLAFGIISLLIGIGLIVCLFIYQGQSVNAAQVLTYIGYLASPAYCSIWAIVAGACGSCANAERSGSMGCIRACVIIFSILAIITAATQTGLCAFVGFLYISSGWLTSGSAYLVAMTVLCLAGALFGLLTFFVSLVHASIGCCCPGEDNRQEQYQMK